MARHAGRNAAPPARSLARAALGKVGIVYTHCVFSVGGRFRRERQSPCFSRSFLFRVPRSEPSLFFTVITMARSVFPELAMSLQFVRYCSVIKSALTIVGCGSGARDTFSTLSKVLSRGLLGGETKKKNCHSSPRLRQVFHAIVIVFRMGPSCTSLFLLYF